MKIVHFDIDDLDSPYGGGQGRRTARINEYISKLHDVIVLSGGHPGARRVRKYGCEYRYLPAFPFPLNTAAFFATAPFRLRALKYDLVVEDFTSPVSCAFTPFYARAPVLGSAQFFFAHRMAAKYHLPFGRVEDAGLKHYKYLIAMTPDQATDMRKRAPNATVAVIPEGVEESAFHVKREQGDYIAFMGRIDWHQKGLDYLVEIAKKIFPIEIRVAGDGRDVKRFSNLISALPNVKYVGKVSGDRRLHFLAGARATIMPSRYETFGMVAIESLAVGTPVVCSNIANLSFAAGNVSTLVAEGDIDGYASALERLAARGPDGIWREMARSHARTFLWEAIARKQLDFYNFVLETDGKEAADRKMDRPS